MFACRVDPNRGRKKPELCIAPCGRPQMKRNKACGRRMYGNGGKVAAEKGHRHQDGVGRRNDAGLGGLAIVFITLISTIHGI
jgi:hypothetical protein